MSTARDYLVSKGLAKPGRGKFSNAAKEELARAMGAGLTFSDWPKGSTAPVANRAPAAKTRTKRDVTPGTAGESEYLYPSDFRFPEGEYVAKDPKGKAHSMRECCNTCRVSLTNHACNSPTIHGNVPVTIVKKGGR